MSEADIVEKQSKSKWFIDLDWFEQNNRSFSVLAHGVLCAKCSQRLKPDIKTVPASELMGAIKKCCSKTPDFINTRLPILESVFRLLLATGNRPLELEEIAKQLGGQWGVGIYRISTGVLYNLLSNDRYYGLSQAQN